MTPKKLKLLTIYMLVLPLYVFIIEVGCDDEITLKDNFKEEPLDFAIIDYNPVWSPDGQWIAFHHADTIPGKSGIYLISPDGEKIKKWHEVFGEYPAWSPDGQWIAFSENAQIWKKKINGDSLTQLTFEGRNFFPTWSPDGKWIAYDAFIRNINKFYAIWKMKYDGTKKTLITIHSPEEGDIRMPDWGNYGIVHIRYIGVVFPEIFMMDSSGANITRLTYNDAPDDYPKISGNKIAFTSRPKNNLSFQICTINIDGTSLKQLTDSRGYACDWSPDGKQIVYTDSRAENGRLWIMDADGSNNKQLTFNYNF